VSSLEDSSPQQGPLEPLRVDTARVVGIGVLLWLVALVLTLVIPALHEGDRSWWKWTCVAGAALGALGWAYVRRGRGNASAA
jgi:hypothetical protein